MCYLFPLFQTRPRNIKRFVKSMYYYAIQPIGLHLCETAQMHRSTFIYMLTSLHIVVIIFIVILYLWGKLISARWFSLKYSTCTGSSFSVSKPQAWAAVPMKHQSPISQFFFSPTGLRFHTRLACYCPIQDPNNSQLFFFFFQDNQHCSSMSCCQRTVGYICFTKCPQSLRGKCLSGGQKKKNT